MRVVILVIANLIMLSIAQAASFDCSKSKTRIEKMICDSPDLRSLDAHLYEAYLSALRKGKNPNDIKIFQRQWLKEVRDRCQSIECLQSVYHKQTVILEAEIVYEMCGIDDLRYCSAERRNEMESRVGDLSKLIQGGVNSGDRGKFILLQSSWRQRVKCYCDQKTEEDWGAGTGSSNYYVSCEREKMEERRNELLEILAGKQGITFGENSLPVCVMQE